MRYKVLCLLLGASIFSISYADMLIGNNIPPKIEYSNYVNGNELANITHMPLDSYLQTLYTGYKVNLNQINNIVISVKGKVPNNPVSIMRYLSKTYGLIFDLDTKKHIITVSPSNNVSYKSYQQGLQSFTKDRLNLIEQRDALKAKLQNVNNVKHDKSSDIKSSVIKKKSIIKKTLTQQLQEALKLAYQFRIAAPLNIKSVKKETIVDAILAYNKKDKVSIKFNRTSKIVAVAESKKEAEALSRTQRNVYYVFAGQTMQETIKRWASYDHINVLYQAKKDFKILQPATIYGTFSSSDGALATLLGSIQNSSYPLKAIFMKNNLLLIQPSTYSTNFIPHS